MTVVLLTGGLGYIGSHIAVEMLNLSSSTPHTIIIIDNLSNSTYKMVDTIKQNHTTKNDNKMIFYEADLLDSTCMEAIFDKHKIDVVIHLAGLKAVAESIRTPIMYYQNNIVSTLNLLNVMKKYNCKNIIFSSSATVYGNVSVAPYNETMPVGVGITNPYGKTKYMQEEILRDLYISDNTWNIILLRYFNPISQKNNSLRESPNGIPCNIFPYIVKVHNGELKQLQVFGNDYNTPDGTCLRDFIHVVDVAIAHVKACSFVVGCGVKTYNIGTGIGISVKQLVDTFEEVNHTKLQYVYGDKREGDIDISYADASLAKKELGWVAQYGIKDLVKII